MGLTTILLLLWWIRDFIRHWQPKHSVPTQIHSRCSAHNRLLTHSLHSDFRNHLWLFCWVVVIAGDILCNSEILPWFRIYWSNKLFWRNPLWPLLLLLNWLKRFYLSSILGAGHFFKPCWETKRSQVLPHSAFLMETSFILKLLSC